MRRFDSDPRLQASFVDLSVHGCRYSETFIWIRKTTDVDRMWVATFAVLRPTLTPAEEDNQDKRVPARTSRRRYPDCPRLGFEKC